MILRAVFRSLFMLFFSLPLTETKIKYIICMTVWEDLLKHRQIIQMILYTHIICILSLKQLLSVMRKLYLQKTRGRFYVPIKKVAGASSCNLLYQYRLNLFTLQGEVQGFFNFIHMSNQRGLLVYGVILTKGDKIHIFHIQKHTYVFCGI